jgi:uncharacterized protein (TIGR02231 family)
MPNLVTISRSVVLLACALGALGSARAADTPSDASRITAVTVYPGSATVQRTLAVAAGAQKAVFNCLSGSLDPASLQVSGAGAIQIGEVTLRQRTRAELGDGCASALDTQIRALEDQIAAVQAQSKALDYVTGYLKNLGEGSDAKRPAPADQIASTVQAIRQSAQGALTRQAELAREQDALGKKLKPLTDERDRNGGKNQVFSTVQVTLSAAQGGTLHLSYQVPGPTWQPGYRATLDTKTRELQLERLGRVRQSSGEDWNDVALTLSTGQPRAPTQPPLPPPWRVGLQPSLPPGSPPLPAQMAEERVAPGVQKLSMAAAQPFGVNVFQGTYATEFVLSQHVTVPSNGAEIALALSSDKLNATLRVRTTPARDASAYLIADFKLPAGVWPSGPVSLYRDGAFVGTGHLDHTRLASDGLAFGRDERVRVHVVRPEQQSGTSGLIGSRNQRVDERRYTVKNEHAEAIALEVLDAAPVSDNDDVKVESTYQPKPQTLDWQGDRGTVAWQQPLAAGATQEFSAKHTITWPRDAHLRDRH